MMSGSFRSSSVEQVIFGLPAADAVVEQAERLGARRVFILAGGHLERETDYVATVARHLGRRFAQTWTGIRPHAPRADILAASRAIADTGADLIVTIGGGSVTDAGKIATLALKHDVRTVGDFDRIRVVAKPDGSLVTPQLESPDIPLVCVPTTLSGGEFNPLSGATDEATKHKQAYDQRGMAPRVVILDPAATIHTPEWLWLSTGIRSVDHAVETLVSTWSNIFADGLAGRGLELLAEGLPRCRSNPADLEARLLCQLGAWHTALPMVAGIPMGASHAIGHVLGGTCGVPHGITSCVMAPYVQKWNAEFDDTKHKAISRILGDASIPAWVLLDRLIANLGMPRKLRDVGVLQDQFDIIAEYTLQDIWGKTNPRPINDQRDIVRLLNMAI